MSGDGMNADDLRPEDEAVMAAIYRQMDDHLAPGEAPYDVEAGLERLMGWMSEEIPSTDQKVPGMEDKP